MKTTAADNPRFRQKKHNSYTLQPDFPAFTAGPLEIRDGFQQLPCLSYIELGFQRSCCSQVLLQQFGTLRVQPRLGLCSHLRAVPGGKAGEIHVGSEVTTVPQKGQAHLQFPLQTAEYLPCVKLGRSSISTAGSCLPSAPSPLFGPTLRNAFIPNYVRGSTKLNKK